MSPADYILSSVLLHGDGVATGQVELAVFVVVGLLGGAHCLGMCGPLVTVYARQLDGQAADGAAADGGFAGVTGYEARQHALFNAGRTVSYTLLGGLFGLLGALVFDTASLLFVAGDAVRATLGIVVGLGIVAVGVHHAVGGHGHGHGGALGRVTAPLARVFGRLQGRLDSWVRGPGIVALGLIHGLLPCPILYPAFLYAFSQGSPVRGALALGLIGLGTFPTLFLYGTVVTSVDAHYRARLNRALGVVFVVVGLMPLAHGLSLFGIAVPHIDVPIYQPLSP